MRIYCGTDIVLVKRMASNIAPKEDGSLPSFVTRCFTDKEIEYCMRSSNLDKRAESFAGRFATKEAVAKALGTGVMTMGIGFTDIETINDESGAPKVKLYGKARSKAQELKAVSISVSISHDGDYAVSYCTILSEDSEDEPV